MKDKTPYRLFEAIPAFLAWTTLATMIIASRFAPTWAAIFIIVFDTYWFFKTVFLSFHLRYTFRKLKANLKVDWMEKIKELGGNWEDVYHLVIFPMYKEPYEVVEGTFESLRRTIYPKDKFVIVLATEERAGEEAKETARRIEKNYGKDFFKFLITTHPAGLPGELPGKGSNETWAAKEVKRLIIDPLKIPYKNIMTSVFDVDTQVPPGYFARLTYSFLTAEHPQRSSYQPVSMYHNNIFEAPVLARVVALSSTFWHMIQQARPEKLTTFSSHSMPFKALVEIGFWETDLVSEDSRIFWQCYFHYNGDWRVVPLLYPVSMDANVASSYWETLLNVYRQQRRWGWGVENVPYILTGFQGKKIKLREKFHWVFHVIESFHSWATNAILIFALGWLPLILGGEAFNETLLSFNLPQITRAIMTFASIGIVSSAVLTMAMLPPKPEWFKKRHYFLYIIQWALMPITLIGLGAAPALEAQTRLMIGGRFRLDYWVTPKGRYRKSSPEVRKESERHERSELLE